MKRVKVLFLFFVLVLNAHAMKMPVHAKSYIVQFSSSKSVDILSELSAFKFSKIEALNQEKTLFLFSFNAFSLPEYQAVTVLRNLPQYVLHQENAQVFLRATVSNDPLIGNQWHLPMIKATEAWDISRRGVNGNGDTIVIAVIDDGLHLKHPDFQGNIWINYADSLGNGIDDDGNGFIDDHYGWNFMSRNSDISDSLYYNAGHGTPVSGIIGARGNNSVGIAGIMWHVKLMIIDVTDSSLNPTIFQSDVLKAYNYALYQRKLYNSSNGKKGAYVVATNASWGVDGWYPHQAPLWCGLYDTLGKYGILNVSAVSNNQDNQVDTDGDMPTLCPSKHLITVGSTTPGDNSFSSGYSTISVDLSAPGANVYSTDAYTKINILNNRLYRNGFSGTSFATPMVTAAIGVLNAYACPRILDTMRINPIKGNILLRRFILEGVDVLPGLAGKNVTSGRLNIKKSMDLMNQYCFGYLGIETETAFPNVFVFPNPGNGLIELSSEKTITQINVFDAMGKQIEADIQGNLIDLSAYGQGVYFIQVEIEGKSEMIKYLKL